MSKNKNLVSEAIDTWRSQSEFKKTVATGLLGVIAIAGVFAAKDFAEQKVHEHQIYETYSDPNLADKIADGEIDLGSAVAVTVASGDTASELANRFGNTYEDRRNLQLELSGQAGADGLQPGEILYMPFAQIDPQRLAHD